MFGSTFGLDSRPPQTWSKRAQIWWEDVIRFGVRFCALPVFNRRRLAVLQTRDAPAVTAVVAAARSGLNLAQNTTQHVADIIRTQAQTSPHLLELVSST